jgi:hypothetical protein
MLVPPSYLDSWCITVKKSRFEIHRGPALVRARFVNYKKCALHSQPQMIKFTSCLPMVGGSLRVVHQNWSPWYSWSIAESGVKHQTSINHLKYTEYNFENRNIMRLFLQGISLSICYLDVNWLIPKISACQVRIWSLLASERSERVTNFIFCRAGWYFFRINHNHIQMTCLSSLNQTKTWIYGTSIRVDICIYAGKIPWSKICVCTYSVRQNTLQNIVRK